MPLGAGYGDSMSDDDLAIALLLRAEQNDGGLEATDLLGPEAAEMSAEAILAALADHHALKECLERHWLDFERDDATAPPVWFRLTERGEAVLAALRQAGLATA